MIINHVYSKEQLNKVNFIHLYVDLFIHAHIHIYIYIYIFIYNSLLISWFDSQLSV